MIVKGQNRGQYDKSVKEPSMVGCSLKCSCFCVQPDTGCIKFRRDMRRERSERSLPAAAVLLPFSTP